MNRVSTPSERPATISRRRLLGVGALALAGGALSGRVADATRGEPGTTTFGSMAGRRRLRIAVTESHAAKLQPHFSRFELEHDATLEVTALPPAELYSRLTVDLLHQIGSVDVVSLSDDWLPSLGRSEVLTTGADLVSPSTAARIHERVAELGRSIDDERLVGVPWTVDVGFTAVADSVVGAGEPPRRWSDFVDLVERQEIGPVLLAGSSGATAAATFRSILIGYGTDIVEPMTNRPTVTDYDARRAVAVLRRLQRSTGISPLAIDERSLPGLLAQGTSSSCVHVWSSAWLEAGLSTGWTLLPPLRASVSRGARLLRAWMLAIPRTAVDAELARAFVEWMLTTTSQRSLLDVGLVPSSRDVLGDRAEQDRRAAFRDIVRGLATATARPRLRSFPEINTVCGEAVATILAGNATPGVAFRSANTEMRRILAREGELRL